MVMLKGRIVRPRPKRDIELEVAVPQVRGKSSDKILMKSH